jgi:diaminopimelate decarboxylase
MTAIAHAPHPFPVIDNQLHIGGLSLTQLADQLGQTPFYVYYRGLMTERVNMLRAALPEGTHLHYAIKANPMPAVITHFAGLVDGFDVASSDELERAQASGMPADRISFAGPGKTDSELRHAVSAGCLIHLESEGEMVRLARIGQDLGLRPKAAVRVNPEFELKSSGMKMGGGPKPFGVDAEQVPALLHRMKALPIDFYGFHIFAGSQVLNADVINESLHKTIELVRELAPHAPGPIRLVNLGGGFGIPYFPGETRLDLARIAHHLDALMVAARLDFPEARFVLELGRYLVGEAGIYVTRVVDRKISRGRVFLVTDGGMHHHLAASGNLGQVLRKNFPVLVGNRVQTDNPSPASVVGALCTPLDILADQMPLGHAQVGDLIAILQSGAYGLTASPVNFLGHPPAVEVLV